MKIILLSAFSESLINIRGPLIRALSAAGHEVLACAPETNFQVAAQLRQFGASYQSVPLDRTGMNPVRDIRFILWLTRFLCKERGDAFFAYNIKPVLYGSLAARLAHVTPSYALISGLGYAFSCASRRQRLVSAGVRVLYSVALPYYQAVFFQNPDDQALFLHSKLLRDSSRAVRINGSGVDLGAYTEAPIPEGPPVYLFVGRLLADKGIREYVDAARLVRRKYPQSRFRVLGRYDTNPSAIRREEVAAWVDEGVIEYVGATMEVRPHLAQCTVFVLPSYREGTPLSVLEAMAVGRPVVTTDVPGCRETVVAGKNGFLVPAKDPESLARAMERFIISPSLVAKMGRSSRKMAVEKFDVNKVNAVIMRRMGV